MATPINFSISLADFLATVVSDGTYADLVDTTKVDTDGAVPASEIYKYGGELWSNLSDGMFQATYQNLYKSVKLWSVADATARDALGSDDDLTADDLLYKQDDTTLWYCVSVDSGTSSTWAAIAATGNVGGPGSSTDNAVARWDGAGGATLQDSTVIITDLGALSGITDITLTGTVDGRDVAADGATLDAHVADIGNPHSTNLGLALASANTTDGTDLKVSNGDEIVGEDGGSISFDAVTGLIQTTDQYITGDLTITGKCTIVGILDPTAVVITEQSANPWTPTAGYGALWVKDSSPTELWFTDDDGTDLQIATSVLGLSSVLAYSDETGGNDIVLTSGDAITGDGAGGPVTISAPTVTITGNLVTDLDYSRVVGSAGKGSTNTNIHRWVSEDESAGSGITYTDDAAFGGYWTASEDGIYAVSSSVDASSTSVGLLINTDSALNNTLVGSYIRGQNYQASFPSVSWTGFVPAGDLIWISTSGGVSTSSQELNTVTVTRVR